MSPAPGKPEPLGTATERTTLAWQRTALAVLAGALLIARLSFEDLGGLSVLVVVVAVPLAVWVVAESRWRARRGTVRGGRAAAVLTAAVVVLAVGELAALVTRW